MKVMVFVKATEETEAGAPPDEQLFTEMMKYNEALVDAGIMLGGDGLRPSSHGARVHFSGKKRSVVDGPFSETKELVAGYWLWKVDSMDDAIEWAKRCPNPTFDEGCLEIRPLYDNDDFGDAFTPEARDLDAQLRQRMGSGGEA